MTSEENQQAIVNIVIVIIIDDDALDGDRWKQWLLSITEGSLWLLDHT